MRPFSLLIAVAVGVTGITAASLTPTLESPAFAQKVKSKKPRAARTHEPKTDFSHQQCSVNNPCSTRNQW